MLLMKHVKKTETNRESDEPSLLRITKYNSRFVRPDYWGEGEKRKRARVNTKLSTQILPLFKQSPQGLIDACGTDESMTHERRKKTRWVVLRRIISFVRLLTQTNKERQFNIPGGSASRTLSEQTPNCSLHFRTPRPRHARQSWLPDDNPRLLSLSALDYHHHHRRLENFGSRFEGGVFSRLHTSRSRGRSRAWRLPLRSAGRCRSRAGLACCSIFFHGERK